MHGPDRRLCVGGPLHGKLITVLYGRSHIAIERSQRFEYVERICWIGPTTTQTVWAHGDVSIDSVIEAMRLAGLR